MNIYDVIITIPSIRAKDVKEAEYKAREEAKIQDRGFAEIRFIEEEED